MHLALLIVAIGVAWLVGGGVVASLLGKWISRVDRRERQRLEWNRRPW